MITAAQIKRFAPSARADIVDAMVRLWPKAEAAGVTTPLRVQHFMTQMAVETGGLRKLEEGLSYSTAARIRKTWPSRFKTEAAAQPYVKNPKALAIKVYGGRMGNAPAPSDDGWRYRGGGMLQTTGREGYRKAGFEDNPDALREPETAFMIAVAEWKRRNCNKAADRDDVAAVRRLINGGEIGVAEAHDYLKKARRVFVEAATARVVGLMEVDPSPAPAPSPPGPVSEPPRAASAEVERQDAPEAPVEVSLKDLRKQSRIARQSFLQKVKSWLGIGVGGGVLGIGSLDEVKDKAESAKSAWDSFGEPVMTGLRAIPLWAYGAVVVAVCLWFLWSSRKIEKARLEDAKTLKNPAKVQ